MKKFLTLCAMVVCAVSLYAKDIKDLVVTTSPKMQCENCENKIKKNLRFEKGVKKIVTDLKNQVVIVTYDADKTNEKNIEEAFAKLDYNIEILPVDATSSVAVGFSDNAKDKACCKEKKSCSVKADCTKADCKKADCKKADCKKADCKKVDCKKADCKKANCTKADCKKVDCKKDDCKKADCKKADCKKSECANLN